MPEVKVTHIPRQEDRRRGERRRTTRLLPADHRAAAVGSFMIQPGKNADGAARQMRRTVLEATLAAQLSALESGENSDNTDHNHPGQDDQNEEHPE